MRYATHWKPGVYALATLVLAFGLAGVRVADAVESAGEARELILCGWDEVVILRLDSPEDSLPEKVWSWKAADCRELPDSMKAKFETTDDCKPVDGGSKILITASSEGVALVERAGGRLLYYASVANAHSADLLPGGRIAVASSHYENRGDRLVVFDLAEPGRVVTSCELSWAHGVIWDNQRERLWALADSAIHVYRLADWHGSRPGLELVDRIALPESGGHYFYPVPHTSQIAFSTSRHCWLFDRNSRRISPHPDLHGRENVKSICVDPETGQLAWVEAEESWWAFRVRMLHPERQIRLPAYRLYKARWNLK